jgi:hypothetical protein
LVGQSKANELDLYRSAVESNLPAKQKSAFARILDKMTGGKISEYAEKTGVKITGSHLRATGKLARQVGEESAMGAAYGYIDAKMGLDVGKVPIDGSTGIISSLGAIAAGDSWIGTEARNVASASFTVLSFRKMKDFYSKKRSAGASVTGDNDMEEDPVLRVGKTIEE